MKRIIIFAAILFLLAGAPESSAMNGALREFHGQRVLHIWGTHNQMGYAHGYLLAEDVMKMMEVYAFPPPGESPLIYEWARQFVLRNFIFSDDMVEEAKGIHEGMIDAGIPEYVSLLKRDFDYNDILVFSSLGEIAELFCSTLIAWKSTTAADPDIGGGLAAAHNTDYIEEPEDAYEGGKRAIVIAYDPGDPGEQRFVSVTYPGLMGMLAGMNESGLGLIINRGAYEVPFSEWQMNPKMEPGAWYARTSLEKRFAAFGEPERIEDLLDYYDENVRQFSSTINQFFGPADRSDPPTVSLEINNKTRVVRYPEDDPWLYPDMMMTLNWEDKLMPQREDINVMRYWGNVISLLFFYQREMTLDNLWLFLDQNSGKEDISVTLHSTIFLPDRMRIGISFWTSHDNAPLENHLWYDFDDLFFGNPDEPDDDTADDASDDTAADDSADDDATDDTADAADDASDDDDDGSSTCGCAARNK